MQQTNTMLSRAQTPEEMKDILEFRINEGSQLYGDQFMQIADAVQGEREILDVANIRKRMGETTGGEEFQKSTEGLVFNKKTGKYTVDPTYAKNLKELNKISLDYTKQQKELEKESQIARNRLTGVAEREKADIQTGIESAQGFGTLARADKLLDLVETGKPEAALLWGKKLFGIETANEVELENLLGKRIIAQLKPTFGSQFTKAEGDWLRSMEADFGKNTEGNRRLIRQGMALVKERARIGQEAATNAGDQRAFQNIQDWMDFRYTADPTGAQEEISPEEQDPEGLTPEEQAELEALRAELKNAD